MNEIALSLLERIQLPDFIHSPAKKKSIISNACVHRQSNVVYKIDIKKYFPSISSKKVYWFFNKIMRCSEDVSGTLVSLCTFQEHLPTGSPISSILSYYANIDMWRDIQDIVTSNGCLLTVYVDDITISGENISRKLIWEIKQRINKNGFSYHKEKRYEGKRPRRITGVIIVNGSMRARNIHHKQLYDLRRKIRLDKELMHSLSLCKKIDGLANHIKSIET